MHRTTINLPESVLHEAKIKALRQDVTVSEVIRDLLARWVAGEIDLGSAAWSRERRVALARAARGMWADREPDVLLSTSRAGLRERDEEVARARLDA